MKRNAIIGFGCAGYSALAGMRKAGFPGEIHIFTESAEPPANPMLTTYYVSGRIERDGMFPFGSLESIADEYGAVIHAGKKVTALEPGTKTVILEDGTRESFDKVLLATGAVPVRPDTGTDAPQRTFTMRSVRDADLLKEKLDAGGIRSAAVIGGSMVGVKVVELLRSRNIPVCLISRSRHIFSATAYEEVAAEMERRIGRKGVSLELGSGLAKITETDGGVRTVLSDGREIEADILVLCIGTNADIGLVRDTGILTRRGIVVEDDMQTSVPGVYAAGDCCEGRNVSTGDSGIIGLWANAAYQGETAGRAMAGEKAAFTGNAPHNITHFMGMDFISIGDVRAEGETRRFGSPEDPTYIRATVRDGRIVCVNILDEYRVSGIIRNYMLHVLSGGTEPMPPALRGYLSQQNREKEFLDLFR